MKKGVFLAHRSVHRSEDRAQHSNLAKDTAEKVVKDIRRATRKQYSAEEKIRIVLEGLRGEDSIAELCRRECLSEEQWLIVALRDEVIVHNQHEVEEHFAEVAGCRRRFPINGSTQVCRQPIETGEQRGLE